MLHPIQSTIFRGFGRVIMQNSTKCLYLPELNMREDEIRLLLATKLLEEGLVSLGKAAEVAGFSEKTFAEILLHRAISPVKYTEMDLGRELENA